MVAVRVEVGGEVILAWVPFGQGMGLLCRTPYKFGQMMPYIILKFSPIVPIIRLSIHYNNLMLKMFGDSTPKLRDVGLALST